MRRFWQGFSIIALPEDTFDVASHNVALSQPSKIYSKKKIIKKRLLKRITYNRQWLVFEKTKKAFEMAFVKYMDKNEIYKKKLIVDGSREWYYIKKEYEST